MDSGSGPIRSEGCATNGILISGGVELAEREKEKRSLENWMHCGLIINSLLNQKIEGGTIMMRYNGF